MIKFQQKKPLLNGRMAIGEACDDVSYFGGECSDQQPTIDLNATVVGTIVEVEQPICQNKKPSSTKNQKVTINSKENEL